jgi:sigma-E factor negative regulatory protein RseB
VTRTRLDAEGWSMRSSLPGFREIACMKRPIEPASDSTAPQVLQSVWSDGLAYVSVFIEPFDADRHTRPMQTAIGATHTLMRRHGSWWVTVMGEVPAPTLRQFAAALERQR